VVERTAPSSGSSDREEREALEAAQVELAQLRSQLAQAEQNQGKELQRLEAACASAERRLQDASDEVAALHENLANLHGRKSDLEQKLKAAKKEQMVLLEGAALRDEQVDWSSNPMGYDEVGRRVPGELGKQILVFLVAGALLLGILLLFGAPR
jgi:hypothetical protein